MSTLLKKLGVPRNVRLFFKPYYAVQPDGSLIFRFGDELEHFGRNFHRVPTAIHPWVAGDGPLLFYSCSAMEAIAFLSFQLHRFTDLSQLRFVAIGNHPPVIPHVNYQKCILLFGSDLPGRLLDIYVSVALSNKAVCMRYDEDAVYFALRNTRFSLSCNVVSLYAFQKRASLRSDFRTYKPMTPYSTFVEQLRAAS